MRCIYDNYGQCVRMVQNVWADPAPVPLFDFWPFMATVFCFFIAWGIAQAFLSPLIAREGGAGVVGKALSLAIAVVGALYGKHILIGMFSGETGHALFISAAFQTHRDITHFLGGAGGTFGVLRSIIS